MTTHITATFEKREDAEEAFTALARAGVKKEQMGMIITDEARKGSFKVHKKDMTEEGFAAGASAGGIVGATLGALGTAGAMVIPGLNVVVTGVWVSMLAGLGAGAAAGGLVGGLAGSGMSEYEAKLVEDEIKKGAVLIAVKYQDKAEAERIKEVLRKSDARNILFCEAQSSENKVESQAAAL